MSQCQQGAILGGQPPKGDGEVHQGGIGGRIGSAGGRGGGRDLDDGVSSLPTDQLPCLVGGNTHQPRTEAIWVPQRAQLAPRDRPGRLDRVLCHVRIAADDKADARHVIVVGADDPCQRSSAPGRGLRHGRRCDAHLDCQLACHAIQMLQDLPSVPPVRWAIVRNL